MTKITTTRKEYQEKGWSNFIDIEVTKVNICCIGDLVYILLWR